MVVMARESDVNRPDLYHPFYVLYLRKRQPKVKPDDIKSIVRKEDASKKDIADLIQKRNGHCFGDVVVKTVIRPKISVGTVDLFDDDILKILSDPKNYANPKMRRSVIYPVIGSDYFSSKPDFVNKILGNQYVLVMKLKFQARLLLHLWNQERKRMREESSNKTVFFIQDSLTYAMMSVSRKKKDEIINPVGFQYTTSKALDKFGDSLFTRFAQADNYCQNVCKKYYGGCTSTGPCRQNYATLSKILHLDE